MRTPNHPAMPVCCALAAQPARHSFKAVLWDFLKTPEANEDVIHGMVTAYHEVGILTDDQCTDIGDEMSQYLREATA